eukprot:INCI5009.7.p1 GENE.INCI5009.7~~INCI5009.7.p1  ORF type:complete len:4054 (+),score=953.74 INCI5009.7:190-12351(+)
MMRAALLLNVFAASWQASAATTWTHKPAIGREDFELLETAAENAFRQLRGCEVDTDSDLLCDTDDRCSQDALNDFDRDGICGNVDSCPFDRENDADSDALCAQHMQFVPSPGPVHINATTENLGVSSGATTEEVTINQPAPQTAPAPFVGGGIPLPAPSYTTQDWTTTTPHSVPTQFSTDSTTWTTAQWQHTLPAPAPGPSPVEVIRIPSPAPDGQINVTDSCPYDAENDVDSDRLCADVDSCEFDAENDVDSDELCSDVDSCRYYSLNDVDSDGICGDVDSCPQDSLNDEDHDFLCSDEDSCAADAENDIDSDVICGDIDSCSLDSFNDDDSDALCADQDSCLSDSRNDEDSDSLCTNADVCPSDALNDGDSDSLCDGVDSCLGDENNDADSDGLCTTVDVCPLDALNDADSDEICDSVDSCLGDAENDADSDSFCTDTDACPSDALNDADSDGICDSSDSCLQDQENDVDSDGLCTQNDICPTDALNDDDSDAICDSVDSCQADGENDEDSDGLCSAIDECPLDARNDADSDGICDGADSCLADADNDQDSDEICTLEDVCPADSLNDQDSDSICDSEDTCRLDATNDEDSDALCTFEDICPSDALNDSDSDAICDSFDSCPRDAGNDPDSDGLCSEADLCPNDALNDSDSDRICASVDSCLDDAENDADSDNLCTLSDACPNDNLNDADSDAVCDGIDSCLEDPGNDIDSDDVCSIQDVCPSDSNNDVDSDSVCDSKDSCLLDAENDVDSDGLCTKFDVCPFDPLNDADSDSVCDTLDTCVGENDVDSDNICSIADVCPADPLNDADSDTVCDGVDSCLGDATNDADSDSTCATMDVCPLDALNDADSDEICDSVDSCLGDAENDADSDSFCTDTDACPSDALNDADSDGICDSSDSCLQDQENDVDSDGLCTQNDICPTDALNDDDSDAICDSVDSCQADGENDEDSDGVCTAVDSCPEDRDNDRDSDLLCANEDECSSDPENDWDSDNTCAGNDPCPYDAANDFDSDNLCSDVDTCPEDPDNDADSDGTCSPHDICPNDIGDDADSDEICGDVDSCPLDAGNDFDSDVICGNVDRCHLDAENDADSDGICGNLDTCPRDSDNDIDADAICADVDSCPFDITNDNDSDDICDDIDSCTGDAANDEDSDGVCTSNDVCPTDALNDGDSDGVCDSADSCQEDAENDADSDGMCDSVDSCLGDENNDADSDGLCTTVDVCPLDALNDADSDGVCDSVDSCLGDAENDTDSDGICQALDSCPMHAGTGCNESPSPASNVWKPRVPTFSSSSDHAWSSFTSQAGGQWNIDAGIVGSARTNFSMVNQRNSFDIEADVEGELTSTYATLATPTAHRASLSLLLRTPVLYAQADRISVVAWPQGPGFGPTRSYQVKLTAENTVGETKTLSCGSATKNSYLSCLVQLDADDWFSTTNTSNVTLTAFLVGTDITSQAVTVQLAPTSSSANADAATLPAAWLELPAFPLVAGSTFAADLYANAVSDSGTEYALSTWIMDLALVDGADFVSCDSDFFAVSTSTSGNKTRLVASLDSSVAAADVTGKVRIATVQIKLGSNFADSSSALLSTLFIDDMVSTSSNKMVNGVDALFFAGGSFATHGFVTVESAVNVGIVSYTFTTTSGTSVDAELVNFKADNGESAAIISKLVPSCHTTNSPASGSNSIKCAESNTFATVSSSTSCTSSNSDILAIASESCATEFTGSESTGGDVTITVAYGKFAATVSLRVWYLQTVAIRASDTILNAIQTDCKTTVFQQARLRAVGVLTLGDNSSAIRDVDITDLVSFSSKNTDVLSVNGNTAMGISSGSAVVSVLDTELTLTVNDTYVSVLGLHSVAVNEISFLNSVALDSIQTFYEVEVEAQAGHVLSQEGDTTSVFVYAVFSDDTYQYVQEGVTAVSLKPLIISVAANATSLSPLEVQVPVGAGSGQGTDLLQLSWFVCDSELATGAVFLDVDMPAVVAVEIDIDNPVLFSSTDPVATSGLSVAKTAEVKVTVEFEDGSTQDFSMDSRLLLESSDPAIDINDNTLSVASSSSGSLSDVTITASFGDYSNLTATATVSVDAYCQLQLSQKSYPACADCGNNKSVIYAFPGLAGGYQQLVLGLKVESCLGSSFPYSLDSSVNVTVSNASVINVLKAPCVPTSGPGCTLVDGELSLGNLVGVAPGSSALTVNWFGDTATTYVTVSASEPAVTGITIHSPTDSLEGEINSTFPMTLTVEFSDGSALKKVRTTSSDIFFDSFLLFASSDAQLVSVSTTGVLSLLSNTPGSYAPEVSVSDLSVTTTASVTLFGNLEPQCAMYDIDFGAESGAPYPQVAVGDVFELPIRINTCDDTLTSFQIKVFFDSSVVAAVKDGQSTSDADWGYDIVYTYNDPATMVQIIGSESNSDVGGTNILLTTLTFQAVGAGTSSFSGEVVDTVGKNGVALGASERISISAAGYIFVDVDWFSRGRDLASLSTANVLASSQQQRRQLNGCTDPSCGCGLPDLNGDVNGDCKFTVSDLDFLKRYIAGDLEFSDLGDPTYQQKQMNPDLTFDENDDATVDGVDINYILYALAKMYRFLDTVDYWVSASNQVHLTVRLLDDTGAYVTDGTTTIVRVELGGLDESDIQVAVGEFTNRTRDGSMMQMAAPTDSSGNFSLVFTPDTSEPGIAFALAIETLDSGGGGSDESTRKFPFWGTTWGSYGVAQFGFVPFQTILLIPQTTVSTLSLTPVTTIASFSTGQTSIETGSTQAQHVSGSNSVSDHAGTTFSPTSYSAVEFTSTDVASSQSSFSSKSTTVHDFSLKETSSPQHFVTTTGDSFISTATFTEPPVFSVTSQQAEPVNCEGSWGAWSTCSTTCGLGSQSRTFHVAVFAENAGAECDYVDGGTASAPCNDGTCVNACSGLWSEWSECTVTCGGGGMYTRIFIADAGQSGSGCVGENATLTAACGSANCANTGIVTTQPQTSSQQRAPAPSDSTFQWPSAPSPQTSTPLVTLFTDPPALTSTTDPDFQIGVTASPTEDDDMMLIIIIVVVVLLLLIIIIIIVVVLRRRRKKNRVAAIVPTEDSKKDGTKTPLNGGPGSRGRRSHGHDEDAGKTSAMANSKGGQGGDVVTPITSPSGIGGVLSASGAGVEHESSPSRMGLNISRRAHRGRKDVGADGEGALGIGGDFVHGEQPDDTTELAIGSSRVNSRSRRKRRASRRGPKPETIDAPQGFAASAASYDHLDTQVLKGKLTLDGISPEAFNTDPSIRAAIADALSFIPRQAGLTPGQIETLVKKVKATGAAGQVEVPFVMNVKVPSPHVALALCDDFNDKIANISPSLVKELKLSLERRDSSVAQNAVKLIASSAHVKGSTALSQDRFGFKVGCNFSLSGINLEEFESDLIIKKSFQSSIDEMLVSMGKGLSMGTPISVVKIAERKGKVIIRCQGVVEGAQEDVQGLAEKFNGSKDLGAVLIPRWQENSLAAGIGTLQKNSNLAIGKYAMRVSKKMTAASATDAEKNTANHKGEVTLSGFKNFDASDIPEMQSLLQKSLKRLQQFQDSDDVKREVLVTGFEKEGDSLNVKYRTRIKRLSRKATKIEAAIPLDTGEFLENLQEDSSQSFAKKFNVEGIEVQRQYIVDPTKSVDTAAPNEDNSELSNVTGHVALEGISKARLNRSPKVLNAIKRVLLKHANCKELDLSADAVTVTSIRTQVDKSIKVNYKIDLQGGTGTAADAAVKRLARGMNPTKGAFLEEVQEAALALGETKMDVMKKMKLKKSKSERVAAVPKRKVKTAAEMVDATRKMLSVAKSEIPDDGEEVLVESRRSRRRRSSRMADTITRTAAAEVSKDEEEAEIMERRRRRQQRGQRRRENEGKNTADTDTIDKISSRRERRRGEAKSEERADDRRSRREQRRARRSGSAADSGQDSAAAPGNDASRREKRMTRGESKVKIAKTEANVKANESPVQIAAQARSHWSQLRSAAADAQTKRREVRLAAISGSAGGGGAVSEGKKKKGAMLRTVTSKNFDAATDELMKQVRETKAAQVQAQAQRRTGIGRSSTRRRSESKADEIRNRADVLMHEELGI